MRSSIRAALVASTALFSSCKALELDVSNDASLRSAAATIANGLMSYYKNNQSNTAAADVGTFDKPIYWWEAGAVWGGLVDYYAYTGDASYVQTTSEALMANIGPNADFLVPAQMSDEGNDDQAFWALSAMSAAENGFPQPSGKPLWGTLAANAFNNMLPRWNTDACGGGFKWQIYPQNSYGYNYRNSISNGGFFQLAARLARYTGNDTYVQWAEKVWNWSVDVGFISSSFQVFDGADDRQNCTKIDENQWTYNNAMYLYGCAAMYAHTGDAAWKDRVNGLVKAAGTFFTQYKNATNVMSEIVCEGFDKCNTDQASFKAYLGRWMAKTTMLAPFTKDVVQGYLEASAKAAAASCSGDSGSACGMKWYVGGFDGNPGVGQQLSALEVIQALLVSKAGMPRTYGSKQTATTSSKPSSTVAPAATSKKSTSTATPANKPAPKPSHSSTPSDIPGVFPEVPSSVSFSLCSLETETVTISVPSPTPSSSTCSEEVVTLTVTVEPTLTFSVESPTSSSVVESLPNSIPPSGLGTVYTSLAVASGQPTLTFSSGFLGPSSTSASPAPPAFTGAAAPIKPHRAIQVMGAVGAVMGVVALL